ncbi:MAG: hypothetical protein PHY29_08745 [Syntrophales bacterium]|nr:hypothetical protein [Syntrophales bacterium]
MKIFKKCATHCTEFKAQTTSRYPDAYIEGGAGRIIVAQGETNPIPGYRSAILKRE